MKKINRVIVLLCTFSGIYCQINTCSNQGLYSKQQKKCICYEGYSGYDCRDRSCEYGLSFADDTARSECSDRGRCNRKNGLCECLLGYDGIACETHSYPVNGGKICSGHGICVSEYDYRKEHLRICKIDSDKVKCNTINVDENQSNYLKRNNICICESGYSGYDCSIKDCPYGLTGKGDDKKGYYGNPTDIATNPTPPTSPSSLASFDIVTFVLNSEYLDLEMVRCENIIDGNERECRYEKIRLNSKEGKEEIRMKLKESGIVNDTAVVLFKDSDIANTLGESNKMILYYILDPYTYVISPSRTHNDGKITSLTPQQCSGYGKCENGKCEFYETKQPTNRILAEISPTTVDPYIKNYGIIIENCQLNTNPTTFECPSDTHKNENGICVCQPSYIGPNCRKVCDFINGLECGGNGKCNSEGKCVCNIGYSGGKCENSVVTRFPDEEEDKKCNGNGNLNNNTGMCDCYEGYYGVTCQDKRCPLGPIIKDYRCENIGNPPQITFKFNSLVGKITVKLNGKIIVNEIDLSSTISQFITTLSNSGVLGDIVCVKDGTSDECEDNKQITPTYFTLQFFYYCTKELNPTDDSGKKGLTFFIENNIISSKVDGFDITGSVDTAHGSLEYTTGTIECDECSGKGECVSGTCICEKNYQTSNGWSKDRKTIEIGKRGDCSHFVEYMPQQK